MIIVIHFSVKKQNRYSLRGSSFKVLGVLNPQLIILRYPDGIV